MGADNFGLHFGRVPAPQSTLFFTVLLLGSHGPGNNFHSAVSPIEAAAVAGQGGYARSAQNTAVRVSARDGVTLGRRTSEGASLKMFCVLSPAADFHPECVP